MSQTRSVSETAVGLERRSLLALCVVVCLLATGGTGPVVGQSDDTTAPTLSAAERGGDEMIVVTISDDQGVDEASIDRDDFTISTGRIENASVSESGSDATVELRLANRLDTENVTVSLAGPISDDAGNTVTTGNATATGMDSRPPQLLDFAVQRPNETTAKTVIETGERLSSLRLAAGGSYTGNFDMRNATETVVNSQLFRYTITHRFDEQGEGTFLLMSVTDEAGNEIGYNEQRPYLADWTEPRASISGPHYVTVNDTHRFSSGAGDNVGLAAVEWVIGPGTTRSGSTIRQTFSEPGARTLTVTVSDRNGNAVTVPHNVTVLPGASKQGVTLGSVTANRTNATVAADRPSQRVRVADQAGRLVSGDGFAVDALTITPPANESFRLNVTAGSVGQNLTAATGRASIGAFSVGHDPFTATEPVTVALRVNRSRLGAAGIDPANVSLYRLNESWDELPTRVEWQDDEQVSYRAESPGLSVFAIGEASPTSATETDPNASSDETGEGDVSSPITESGVETGSSETGNGTGTNDSDVGANETASPEMESHPSGITVETVTLASTTVTAGENAVVTVRVYNSANETSTRRVDLSARDEVVATRRVTIPPKERRTLTFTYPVTDAAALAVNGTTAGTVRPATASEPTSATPTQTATPSTVSETETGGGGLPNPLALWPGGLVGTVLGAVLGLLVGGYAILKAVALYLGY